MLGVSSVFLVLVSLEAQTSYAISLVPNGYVDVAETVWQSNTKLTIAAWIHPLSLSSDGVHAHTIFVRVGPSSHGVGLRCGGDGMADLFVGGSDWSVYGVSSPANAVQVGSWTHVAGTFDGSTLRFYVNGLLVNSVSVSPFTYLATGNAGIGRDYNYGRYYNGYIDDLVVYSRDLDSNEVYGLLMGTIPAENLEHYFRFNEGSGLATLDQKSGLSSILNGSYSWVESEPPTLPVELSSFTGFTTSDGKATLTWITQSESNLSGYYLLRSQESELESAMIVSPLIEAYNLPTEQRYSFKDNEVEPGIWHYWLEVNELDGSNRFFGPVLVEIGSPLDDSNNPEIPQKHGLISISPNPFNPNARIIYNIRKARTVELQIYNHRGQLIQILKHHHSEPGQYQAFWDGKDAGGNDQGSGLYLCRLIAGEDSSVMKMVLMK